MRTLDQWLAAYGADHQNLDNQRLHRLCVPAIFFAIVGLLHGLGRLGDVVVLLPLFWYAALGPRALGLMLAQLLVAAALADTLTYWARGLTPWILIAVFVVAWVGQFYGHHLERRRPSFFTDLQYLLIGPLWVWLGH